MASPVSLSGRYLPAAVERRLQSIKAQILSARPFPRATAQFIVLPFSSRVNYPLCGYRYCSTRATKSVQMSAYRATGFAWSTHRNCHLRARESNPTIDLPNRKVAYGPLRSFRHSVVAPALHATRPHLLPPDRSPQQSRSNRARL